MFSYRAEFGKRQVVERAENRFNGDERALGGIVRGPSNSESQAIGKLSLCEL